MSLCLQREDQAKRHFGARLIFGVRFQDMYPVRLGYKTAVSRIRQLIRNGHQSEALVTTVFTVEKTLRRTLRQIVVSAGFTSAQADKIVRNLRGLDAIKAAWEIYEPRNRKLTELLSATDWSCIKDAASMRNRMIHGERVYELATCKAETENLLSVLDRLKDCFDDTYGYSGWDTASKRLKSRLHDDPKVKV